MTRFPVDAVESLLIKVPSAQGLGKEVRGAVEPLNSNQQLGVDRYRPTFWIERVLSRSGE